MGMTLRDPSQADFNQLKKMLVDGTITPQQLQGADVSYTGPPERIDQSSQNMLAQMMQGQDSPQIAPPPTPEPRQNGGYMQVDGGPRQSIGQTSAPTAQSKSEEAGKALNQDGVPLNQLEAGGGYQGLKSGQGIIRMTQPDESTEDRYLNIPQNTAAKPMKVYGYDQGMIDDLGTLKDTPFNQGALKADYSRGMIEIPGMGKGYYSQDGRHSIMTAPDGTKYAALIGYDRAGSQAIADANMQRQKTQGDITHTAAETALVNAKVDDYGKPDAAAANEAVSPTQIVDPKDGSRMLSVDARKYKGGTLGDVGVIGVSGKEPTLGKAEDKKTEGREGLKLDIQAMRDGYQKLDDLKAIPNIDNTPYENFKASAASSDFGQAIGNKLGTNEQEIRNEIDASKRRLLSSIKAATNAGSREFGTNYEMKLWMDSMGSTQRPVGGNLDILNEFEKKYITGPEAREAAKKALNNPASANGSSAPNVTDPSNSSSNMPPPLIRSADTSASIRNAQAAINSGKWTRAQAIEKLRSAGIMDTP